MVFGGMAITGRSVSRAESSKCENLIANQRLLLRDSLLLLKCDAVEGVQLHEAEARAKKREVRPCQKRNFFPLHRALSDIKHLCVE